MLVEPVRTLVLRALPFGVACWADGAFEDAWLVRPEFCKVNAQEWTEACARVQGEAHL
jgi:hypothetical protein